MSNEIVGFSKLSKTEKIAWLQQQAPAGSFEAHTFEQYFLANPELQQLHDEFSENTLSNFVLPFSVAPNFLINDRYYAVPMAIEESSVVAAAAKSAKYWASRGGFKTTVLGTEKIGQVHFMFKGDASALQLFFDHIKADLIAELQPLTQNMQKRGGGIRDIEMRNKTRELAHYYQLHVTFETVDSMGANFINTCLEQLARDWDAHVRSQEGLVANESDVEIVMSILSNYVPNCVVRAAVSCPIAALADKKITNPQHFAEKMVQALAIATVEPFRAVTHNKGIMNGIDAVVVATGNDFRAVEAGVHAYAARSGQYRSLSTAWIEDGHFHFELDVPLALGTVGGLTALHPLVKSALAILQNPSAAELMQIAAAVGLAQNFAAVRSLTTTGIQEGHMKMHLNNILNQHGATADERIQVYAYFKDTTISHSGVVAYLQQLRSL